jgi:hypothetical protein
MRDSVKSNSSTHRNSHLKAIAYPHELPIISFRIPSVTPMLTIRKEQLAAFSPLGKQAFEDRMIVHLKKVFPEQCESLGEPKLRESIQYGTQRAASYKITSERDVCKYLDLMIFFGRDFDKDPNLPWAQSILQNQAIRNPSSKVERLYKAAKKQENQPKPRKQP